MSRSRSDYREFVDLQLIRSKQRIEAELGGRVDMLVWPFAIHDAELESAARDAGYVAGFVLGNRAASADDDVLALPRFWISDGDRPWLQAFRDYAFDRRVFAADEVIAQIRAAEDFGSDGWMLWNPHNIYDLWQHRTGRGGRTAYGAVFSLFLTLLVHPRSA